MKRKFERFKSGLQKLKNKKIFLILPIIFLLYMGMLLCLGKSILKSLDLPFYSKYLVELFFVIVLNSTLIGLYKIIIKIGTPLKARKIEKIFEEIGFVDNDRKPPILLSEEKLKNGSTFLFYSPQISLFEFQKEKPKIENALNIKIVSFALGKDMQHLVVNAITNFKYDNNIIYWLDKKLRKKDFELVVGESIFGDEIIDFSSIPHALVGGGSGSGKSVLLKSLLMQSVKKGAIVHIIDFKGAVDYNNDFWRKNCNIITDTNKFNNELDNIIEIMETRKKLLFEAKTVNLKEYNIKTEKNIPRIVIAVDEVAEVLDKTGLDKKEKEFVSQIESKLSTLARLSRAMGIHLILCTQRPEADLLKGQIKSNLGYRICGRADEVLSRMILDNTSAAEMISATDQGMFLTNTGVLFKGFFIDDSKF